MTSNFMRPSVALALVLALAGCGGKASFQISGTVEGLQYAGLVLSTNGMNLPVPSGATSFIFPNSLSYGDEYAITPTAQPLHQTCVVASGGADTAGRTASINARVVCAVNEYAIGGTISGLTSAGLVLTNGSSGGTVTAVPGATTFALAPVRFGTSYGVTVLAQPAKETCSVTQNGTGVMGDAAVANIVVACVPKP